MSLSSWTAKQLLPKALLALGLFTPVVAHAQASFFDGFDTNTFNPSIWEASSGTNGDPFGCTFYPAMVTNGTGGNLALTLHNGACSQIETYAQYLYGTLQTRLVYSNVPGTVASLFTYNSFYNNPSDPWTEIDIEFLPSKGDVLHTNIIYQATSTAANQQWEKYIDLTPYNINPVNAAVQVGFDWSATAVSWFIYDSNGNKQYLRTVTNSNATNCDCVPSYAWPDQPANIYANYWHGDNNNSSSVDYFPLLYNYGSGTASYDFVQYIAAGAVATPAPTPTPATSLNGTHTLTPQNATGLRLDDLAASTASGNPIDVYTANGTGAQSWNISNAGVVPSGFYNLSVEGGSGYCLTASSTSSGSAVVLEPCNGSSAQSWNAVANGSTYSWNPANNTSLCLDVRGDASASGTLVQAWTCNGGPNEQWAVN